MLHFHFLILLILALTSVVMPQSTHYGSTDVQHFRLERDREFRDPEESPLAPEDRENFSGLTYFPETPAFRVTAAYTATPGETYFLMPTSSGESQRYVKTGFFDFEIAGRKFRLSSYSGEVVETDEKLNKQYGHLIFIPFRDRTSGSETYGTGRYIFIAKPAQAETILDFNLAFNPSCAYSNGYVCPIPPKENFLDIEIIAGEKRYVSPSKVEKAKGRLRP